MNSLRFTILQRGVDACCVATALGNCKDNPEVAAKLQELARDDQSFRTRSAALQALGKLKAPDALATLSAAVAADSPDGILRNAALRAMGSLGDDKAVPTLKQWAVPSKPMDTREAAIAGLARLEKDNKEITQQIAGYLTEGHAGIRFASIYALGQRGDASAIPALEALLKNDNLSIEMAPMIKGQIAQLQRGGGKKPEGGEAGGADAGDQDVAKRLERLEKLMQQMAERLKTIEERLPPQK